MRNLILAMAISAVPLTAVAGDNFYVGAYGGYGSLRAGATVSGASGSTDLNGGRIGGFAGADFLIGQGWLIGLEGDLSYDWNSLTATSGGFTGSVGTDFGASVRGKLGYDFGPANVFLAGGWTGTNLFANVTGLGSANQWLNGYTVGAGVDFKITENMFARGEYRFNQFETLSGGGSSVDFRQHVVNVGLGLRF
ncbi:MAG TPA: outer membrane beta-barrel protein [Ensifer sp.]|nr:outer membrane beta-barrel protein [Ensifer sp.]